MPVYEFCCPRCGAIFDCSLPFSASGMNVYCPECKEPAQKVFHPVTFLRGFGRTAPMDWGKHNVDVNYPDGHTREQDYNDLYDRGGL